MSMINIGLQCIGVMNLKISDETEEKIENCTTLKQLREKVGFKQEDMALSLKLCTDLLSSRGWY